MFPVGRSLIATLEYKGKAYNYCFFWDPELNNFNTQFIEGDFQVANPTLLWASGWVHIPDPLRDPREVVLENIGQLNVFLIKQFEGQAPITWGEQLETFFRKVVFFLDQGIPQAKVQD
jgi:hypothetical protein